MKPANQLIILLLLVPKLCYQAYSGNEPDTNAIIILNQKAWKIRNTDLEMAKHFALEAIQSANKMNYPRGLSYSFNILGHYYKVKENYDSAQIYYRKSLAIRKKLRDTVKIAHSYRNLMSIDKILGKYKQAISTGLLALQLLTLKPRDADAAKEMAWVQVNLASLYHKTGDFSKATHFALYGKNYFDKHQDEEGAAAAAINLGNIYETQKQYEKALIEYDFAIQSFSRSDNRRELAKAYNNTGNILYAQNKYGLALAQYKKGLEIRLNNDFTGDIKNSLLNIGIIYEALGRNDSAFRYYELSLSLSIKSGNVEGQYEAYRSLGTFTAKNNEHEKALLYLLRSLYLSGKSSASPEKMILLKEISNVYRATGKNDSALFYADEYLNLSDSLSHVLRNSITLESNLKEKEYRLALSEEKNKKQTAVIIGTSTALGSLIIIFLMYFYAAQAKKRELRLKEVIKEKELMVLDAMLQGQDEERKRLAAELHDTIGSILSATKYAFKAMENSIEKLLTENKFQYEKIDGMLDQAMESVRKISHNMAEGIITDQGLERALMELCETLSITGKIKFDLNMHGFDSKMDYTTESNLYRIIQELLTNIIKHAQAKSVSIQLIKSNTSVNLVVEDDGKGFNRADPASKKGMGLSNIDGRVKKLSGKWKIDSGKGKGSTIIIDIPLSEDQSM